jgi:hypothetical protein
LRRKHGTNEAHAIEKIYITRQTIEYTSIQNYCCFEKITERNIIAQITNREIRCTINELHAPKSHGMVKDKVLLLEGQQIVRLN